MLKRVLKEKIVDSLRKVSGYKILVVDEEALRVLDSCLKMSQVLSEGVLTVEGYDLQLR